MKPKKIIIKGFMSFPIPFVVGMTRGEVELELWRRGWNPNILDIVPIEIIVLSPKNKPKKKK